MLSGEDVTAVYVMDNPVDKRNENMNITNCNQTQYSYKKCKIESWLTPIPEYTISYEMNSEK